MTGSVPRDRWDTEAYFDADPDAPGRVSTTYGSFVSDVDRFDASFLAFPARSGQHGPAAENPARKLLGGDRTRRSFAPCAIRYSTGVFVGLCNSDYTPWMLRRGEEALDTYVATGAAPSMAAGRISYTLGLHGPSLAVDTACSASLVAVHLACQSLLAGECVTALAGGVNLITLARGDYCSVEGAHDGRRRAMQDV